MTTLTSRYRVLIILACVFVFAQNLNYPAVYDDVEFITKNPLTSDATDFGKILTSNYGGEVRPVNNYRPLGTWSFALNRELNTALGLPSMHPVGFHLVNLALHAGVSVLLFSLLLQLGVVSETALFCCLLFAVLPIHVEAVTGFVGRLELLSAFFGVLFLLGHRKRWSLLWVCLCCLLSALGKENGILFPFVAVAFDTILPEKVETSKQKKVSHRATKLRWDRRYNFYLAILAFWAVIRGIAVKNVTTMVPFLDNPTSTAALWVRVLTACKYQLIYLTQTWFPYHLASDSSFNQIPLVFSPFNPSVLLLMAIVVVMTVFAWRKRESQPLLLACCFMYPILFCLSSNFLIPIGTTVADREIYSPSIALCTFVGLLLFSESRRRISTAILTALVLGYGGLTIHRNLSWKNELTFYQTQVEASPLSAKAHYNLGTQLAKEGADPAAIAEYDKALAIFPPYPEATYNLGNSLRRTHGDPELVIKAYRDTLRYDPLHYNARNNLVLFLRDLGRNDEAMKEVALGKASGSALRDLSSFPQNH